jgi:hypothetical protein
MRKAGLAAFVLVLALPMEARVGRIHYQKVSLEQLVRMAPVIVVAREVPDSRKQLELGLGEGIDPYRHAELRYRVEERLRGPAGLTSGAELVLTSFAPDDLRMHIEYHAMGLSRSPLVPAYEPEPPLPQAQDAPRILFLERRTLVELAGKGRLEKKVDGHALVCMGAMEAVGKRQAVLELLAAHPAVERLQITVGTHGPRPDAHEGADTDLIDALRALFPGQDTLSWTTQDVRPRRR